MNVPTVFDLIESNEMDSLLTGQFRLYNVKLITE